MAKKQTRRGNSHASKLFKKWTHQMQLDGYVRTRPYSPNKQFKNLHGTSDDVNGAIL